jgi:hypothetical protein
MKIFKENGFVFIIDDGNFFKMTEQDFFNSCKKFSGVEFEELVLSSQKINTTSNKGSNGELKWIRMPRKSCLIIEDVDPVIKFNGIYDVKSVDSIIKTYGKIPDQINMYVSMGKLEMITDDTAKYILIEKENFHKEKPKTKKEIKRRDGVSASDKSDDDFESDSIEDRLIRNAKRINI